jgi:flavin-dependent dehydrogenase
MSAFDLVVVGGGPAGLAAAIDARMRGMSVALIEPRIGARDKACGEGLMPGALPLLNRLGVHPAGHVLRGVTYRRDAHAVTHNFSNGTGLGVRRTELSRALELRAQDLGVQFIHATVDQITQDSGEVSVSCSTGASITSSYLIGADGLHSSIAKNLGLTKAVSPRRRRRYGIRQHFAVTPWSDFIEVFYTPQAEVYITPVSEREIGVAVLGPRATDYDATLASIPELAARLSHAQPSSARAGAGSFPQKTRARRLGRVLLVGDASGYVDAITGEGLRLGFAQAQAAVSCIRDGHPERYERLWNQVSRDFRVLTVGLTALANSPIRGTIVPLAQRLPRLFGTIVDRLAR